MSSPFYQEVVVKATSLLPLMRMERDIMEMMMPKVEIRNLSKSYGAKAVLTDVSLTVPAGEFVMLKGASGAGKSTLLNIIGGLEPLSTGAVLIDGRDVSQLSSKERTEFFRHKVGFIFQGFYLQPQLTVAENIALPGVFAKVPKAERKQRVQELAEILHITDVLRQKPAEISGGQAERVCVARALFMNPEIILADEPTNNLDPENARKVVELLQEVWRTTGTTIIVASHDAVVQQFATLVIEVRDGEAHAIV